MISSLRGGLLRKKNSWIEVDVNGVGYGVNAPNGWISKLSLGQEIEVFTYMAVSENDISLYGLEKVEEVELFKLLISVSGIGPKSGILIFSDKSSQQIRQAIMEADVGFFEKIKGIGKKTAQRIIIDLKSKIGSQKEIDLKSEDVDWSQDELFMALVQLGFDKKEIRQAVAKVPEEVEKLEERIEWCLKVIR
ncbi:Holliday junction branch migration protein RuvA [Candidatus Shapirobacteria bacterium]|nr:MAG: Holliday junction branch migration protein RuvA [Candidatus Shapirobacteria bacterium]